MVVAIGFIPGLWHQDSTDFVLSIFKDASPPSLKLPPSGDFKSDNVVAGFRVLATSAAIGSIPHLCVASDAANGIEIVLQLGL